MLEIFNDLKVFFEDVYVEIGVREYSRKRKISPPTASVILERYSKEGILEMRKERNLHLFKANLKDFAFKDLAIAFWRFRLRELFADMHNDFLFNKIVLFGSIAKSENKRDSDVDLYVDMQKSSVNLFDIEKELGRKVQMHHKDALKNKNLKDNIEKGVRIL
jgi:predicted nucleotidyltransferase